MFEPELRLLIQPSGKKWRWEIEQGFDGDNKSTIWRRISVFEGPWNTVYDYDMPATQGVSKSEYDAELAGRRASANLLADISHTMRVKKHIEINTTVINL